MLVDVTGGNLVVWFGSTSGKITIISVTCLLYYQTQCHSEKCKSHLLYFHALSKDAIWDSGQLVAEHNISWPSIWTLESPCLNLRLTVGIVLFDPSITCCLCKPANLALTAQHTVDQGWWWSWQLYGCWSTIHSWPFLTIGVALLHRPLSWLPDIGISAGPGIFSWLIGNGTGNPGVFWGNLHSFPSKPAPAHMGMGLDGNRSRVESNSWEAKPLWACSMGWPIHDVLIVNK